MDFKDRLRYYREQRGYSSDELAKLLDIPYTTLKGYENAGREPKYNILVKIADILNVSLDDLLGRTPADEDERLKKTIEDVLSISDIKFLKLHDINSGFITFEICGNDENFIHHASFRKKDLLAIIELIQNNFRKKEKIELYAWFILIGIRNTITELNKEVKDLENNTIDKITKYENTEFINQRLTAIKELQDIREIIYKRFPGSYEVTSQNNK
ncbi:helix-turn-helix transcriptional regulator [uncultured Megamonas sp.]|uniref:helix-turn-helix domain-containing protein n=1 Tax=uncultured Megamonas sp. TaxID=286140 RepID=UPI00259B02B7|nr:helix-turn-helix transcriptional regulator [uncultured Megamonas sp.]